MTSGRPCGDHNRRDCGSVSRTKCTGLCWGGEQCTLRETLRMFKQIQGHDLPSSCHDCTLLFSQRLEWRTQLLPIAQLSRKTASCTLLMKNENAFLVCTHPRGIQGTLYIRVKYQAGQISDKILTFYDRQLTVQLMMGYMLHRDCTSNNYSGATGDRACSTVAMLGNVAV